MRPAMLCWKTVRVVAAGLLILGLSGLWTPGGSGAFGTEPAPGFRTATFHVA